MTPILCIGLAILAGIFAVGFFWAYHNWQCAEEELDELYQQLNAS